MTSPGVVEDTLIIHNRNDEPVIFKIKTTAAKHVSDKSVIKASCGVRFDLAFLVLR